MVLPSAKSSKKDNLLFIKLALEGREKKLFLSYELPYNLDILK